MSNIININKNAVDTRPLTELTPEEIQVRADVSISALKVAMQANDVAGALAALKGYAEEIDIQSYIKVKMILAHSMKDCGRVCYNPDRGWYDAADYAE